MDLNKLTPGDQIIGISSIVLLVLSFLTWFEAESDVIRIIDATANGWNGLVGILAMLIAIGSIVYVVLKAMGTSLPQVNWGLILLITGCVAFAFVLIKVLAGLSVEVGGQEVPDEVYETSRKFPAYLGIVASAGMAIGGFLKFQAEKAGSGIARPGPGTGPTV